MYGKVAVNCMEMWRVLLPRSDLCVRALQHPSAGAGWHALSQLYGRAPVNCMAGGPQRSAANCRRGSAAVNCTSTANWGTPLTADPVRLALAGARVHAAAVLATTRSST